MPRFLSVIFVVFATVAAIPTESLAAPYRVLSEVRSGMNSTVFQASFKSRGLKGWTKDAGSAWHLQRGGIVAFGGSASGSILSPFSTRRLHDFAVTASIETAGKPLRQDSGFGVEVRGVGPANGILGGSFSSPSLQRNQPLLAWGTDTVGGASVTLRPGYNTYRLEVHGTDYTLFIDGTRIVRFRVTAFETGSRVGIWGANQKLRIRSFTVTRLPPATPLRALPPVKTINLRAGDVPVAFTSIHGYYFTNVELARLSNTFLDAVTASGLLISYQAGYSNPNLPSTGPVGVFTDVYAYKATEPAQVALGMDVADFQSQWSGKPNYTSGDLSGLGDEAHVLSYEYTETTYGEPGIAATAVGIFFRRGTYEVALFEDFVQSGQTRADMIAQATALATIVDTRAKQTASTLTPRSPFA